MVTGASLRPRGTMLPTATPVLSILSTTVAGGGGDVRTDVGTIAEILQTRELPDGRFAVAAVGTRRVRVTRWLEDDPYPRAEVEAWPDEPDDPEAAAGAAAALGPGGEITVLLRRSAALAAELGEAAPPVDLELADDPALAGFQAVAVAPLGPADRQTLLATPSVAARAALLAELLAGSVELLEARLAAG